MIWRFLLQVMKMVFLDTCNQIYQMDSVETLLRMNSCSIEVKDMHRKRIVEKI